MTAIFCNTRYGRVRRHDLFGNAPAGYAYTLEHDRTHELTHLTELEFRQGVTIGEKSVNLSKHVEFAGGWRTL